MGASAGVQGMEVERSTDGAVGMGREHLPTDGAVRAGRDAAGTTAASSTDTTTTSAGVVGMEVGGSEVAKVTKRRRKAQKRTRKNHGGRRIKGGPASAACPCDAARAPRRACSRRAAPPSRSALLVASSLLGGWRRGPSRRPAQIEGHAGPPPMGWEPVAMHARASAHGSDPPCMTPGMATASGWPRAAALAIHSCACVPVVRLAVGFDRPSRTRHAQYPTRPLSPQHTEPS